MLLLLLLSRFNRVLTLCNPIDGSPPGSSPVPGILQARIPEWVSISFFNACMHAKSLPLCPTLCDPWIAAHQASLSTGFSRQEYWSGLPFPFPLLCLDLSYFWTYILFCFKILQVMPTTPLQVFALSPRFWFLSSCRGHWNQSQLSMNFTCSTICSVWWLWYMPKMTWENAGKMLHLSWIPMDASFSICCYHIVSSRYKDRNRVPRDSSDPFMGCLLLGCTLCDYKGNHRSLGFQTQVVKLLALKVGRLVLTGLGIGGISSLVMDFPCLLHQGVRGSVWRGLLAPGAFLSHPPSQWAPQLWGRRKWLWLL